MTTELVGVLQLAIPARDIDRATAFYRDALRLRFLMNGPNMVFFDCASIRIYVDANPGTAEAGGNSMIYFRTANIEQTHAAYKDRGVTIHKAPHIIANLPDSEVWLMWIRDSESNLLGVMEERHK